MTPNSATKGITYYKYVPPNAIQSYDMAKTSPIVSGHIRPCILAITQNMWDQVEITLLSMWSICNLFYFQILVSQ